MALLGARDLTLAYGADAPLLDSVGFHVEPGERIALVGRNGCGKSTLLTILAGERKPDAGEVILSPGTRVARLGQDVPRDLEGDVFQVVAAGVAALGDLLARYHHASQSLDDDRALARFERLQAELEAANGWDHERRVETVLSRLDLPADAPFETLSGGLKRRVLLGRALVAAPDLLLLDEPTNHFDIPAIEWLEETLLTETATVIFVTHDRAFLKRLATRIFDLDRGQLRDWPGDYQKFLDGRRHQREIESTHNARFDKKLAQEESWIRQGIKARRTRNEGRVRALERLREERKERRVATGQARLRVDKAGRSGKIVLEAEDLAFRYDTDGPLIVDGLSTTILRGDKIGILGPNGVGKTTLIKLLLGECQPTSGTVRHGTRLEAAYFDQHRAHLDLEASVADNVASGNDMIEVGGTKRHVISYLQDFLFPPEQTRSPVATLSGGERNRLLLARLFTRPFNLLVMDEPTNDLDIETLELLESLLVGIDGTLLLVSHDRAFLDNVVTSTLAFEGPGVVAEYPGGYSDWLDQRPAVKKPSASKPKTKAAPATPPPRARKLNYREKQELEALPLSIEALESEQSELHATLADPSLYRDGGGEAVAKARRRLSAAEVELETAYARWTEFDSRT